MPKINEWKKKLHCLTKAKEKTIHDICPFRKSDFYYFTAWKKEIKLVGIPCSLEFKWVIFDHL